MCRTFADRSVSCIINLPPIYFLAVHSIHEFARNKPKYWRKPDQCLVCSRFLRLLHVYSNLIAPLLKGRVSRFVDLKVTELEGGKEWGRESRFHSRFLWNLDLVFLPPHKQKYRVSNPLQFMACFPSLHNRALVLGFIKNVSFDIKEKKSH